jgi:tRNA(Ile2) C34 agmatinyltransferase TiaS
MPTLDLCMFLLVISPLFVLMLYITYKIHDRCPQCFTKMVPHSEFSNGWYCPNCKRLRLDD